MKLRRVTVGIPLVLALACGGDTPNNPEAPPAENIVYGIEFGKNVYSFRDGSHRIFIAFTDEPVQSSAGKDTWTVGKFCERAGADRSTPVVHTYWSGAASGGSPSINFEKNREEDPFDVAKCTQGTAKVIEADASDLVLPDMPVTEQLTASALVEYVTDVTRGTADVEITMKTNSADGKATFHTDFGGLTANAEADNSDIPETADAAPGTTINNITPQAEFSSTEGNPTRIRVNLLGLMDPTTGKPIDLVAGESIFLTENRLPKGIKVSQSTASNDLPIDIVFVLDNSGSMYEEANAISDKLEEFAQALADGGLDIRFGIVGVNGNITGGHNLTDAKTFKDFLSAGPRSGRAEKFAGPDADEIREKAESFDL